MNVRRLAGSMQIPKYLVLESVLRESLQNMVPGERLPSEGDLARQFGVSRVTLQRALRQLADEGVISRQQGKGTFFVGFDKSKPLQVLSGALDSLMVYESGAHSQIVDKNLRSQPSPRILDYLGLPPGTPVVTIKRILIAEGEPLLYLVNYLPSDLGEMVFNDDREMENFPIISLLRDKYEVPLIRATQTIEAVLADPVVANHLAIAVGSPLLLVERIYYRTDGRAAQFTQSWYRSDRHKYTVTLRDWQGPRWQPGKRSRAGAQARKKPKS